jgi:hypothetical protein
MATEGLRNQLIGKLGNTRRESPSPTTVMLTVSCVCEQTQTKQSQTKAKPFDVMGCASSSMCHTTSIGKWAISMAVRTAQCKTRQQQTLQYRSTRATCPRHHEHYKAHVGSPTRVHPFAQNDE